ncbi:putative apoptosis-inducing factor 1, mitochondrial [Contarinia nasturtii]|uniref:putative apoptosis-inducing factor 1, mitochondrial n=1 Tax=Contarinia nasturtii TaxID=265458 RepID=UPI0012D3CEB6|nr:putative apoptosis-inducing factor 1, mitochondrial [Contarinia nasturtii]
MCLLRLKHLPTKLISQRLCTPKNQPGSQVRMVVSATNGGLTDKNNGTINADNLKTKKLAHEYEPVLSQQQNSGYSSIQLPPPSTYSSQNEGVWIAALAFILGINVGGAYIVYNSKIKKTITFHDSEKSGQSKKPKVPLTSSEIPSQVPYLIIGGGTASFSAFRAIQEKDPKAKILVLSKELDTPYMRPPLSKELWIDQEVHTGKRNDVLPLTFKQWNGLDRDLHYEPNEFYIHPSKLMEESNDGGVAIVQGYTVKKVDVENRTAILTDGTEIQYGSCLIATGSSPRNLPVFENAPTEVKKRISLFKTIDDYSNLKKYVDQSKSIAIVGGGFLGSELACGLAKYGQEKKLQVHQVFHEQGNMGKILPEFLSKWTTERVRDLGVNVIPNTEIKSVELLGNNNRIKLTFCNGQSVICDHIVVAVGSSPNISLAKESGLEVDKDHGGFLVNAELEARNHLFVAGDAASFYDPILGRRRVEHHDHAVVSGRLAGENMLGTNKNPYTHQSMFWSDLGPQVSYEGLGKIDSKLPTVSVFVKKQPSESASNSKSSVLPSVHAAELDGEKDDFSKGVVFYMENEKIVGIVLWNVFDRINIARQVLSQDKQYDGPTEINELAKLFDMHT